MSLVLIGIVGWMALAVFVCSLGRAAKVGDRQELARRATARSPAATVSQHEPATEPLLAATALARRALG